MWNHKFSEGIVFFIQVLLSYPNSMEIIKDVPKILGHLKCGGPMGQLNKVEP